MAAKGDKTPHDAAELTLVTLEYYRRNGPAAGAPVAINHDGDARNIAHFLTEHLPAETLTALRNQFAEHTFANNIASVEAGEIDSDIDGDDEIQDVVADVLKRATRHGFQPDEKMVRGAVEESASLLNIRLSEDQIVVACARVKRPEYKVTELQPS